MNLTVPFCAVAAMVFILVAWNMILPISSERNISFVYGIGNKLAEAIPSQEKQPDIAPAVIYDGTSPCNCVVFRMDDVQDQFLRNAQIGVMDVFIEKNQRVSLGVIAGHYGDDPFVANKVLEGKKKGLFEIGLHGWNHDDYSALSKEVQRDSLMRANEKLEHLFGSPSDVFFAPYNKFNNGTIEVMSELGIRVISSSMQEDKHPYFAALGQMEAGESGEYPPYHLPAAAYFRARVTLDNESSEYQKIPVAQVLAGVDSSIAKYGYAVIVLHPQDFVETNDSRQVDDNSLNDLAFLIDSVHAKGYAITTFSGIVGSR